MRKSRRWGWLVLWAFTAMSLAVAGTSARGATLAIDSVTPSAASVPKYARVELAVALSNVAATKFYDPDPAAGGLDLSATFTSPTSGTWNIKGYYNGSCWLVRFAPNQTGTWTYAVTAADPSGTSNTVTGSFECVASASPGWARVDGRYLRFPEGQVLFAVGHNTGWQTDVEQPSLAGMAAKGENLLSFWLAAPWYKVSWGEAWAARTPIENSEQGIGNYNQAACAYLDGVVQRAEAAGVYLLPTIWSHGQLRDVGHPWGEGWWWNNAYNSLGSATDFFQTGTSEQWRYQRNFYRYLIARWGYSRAIAGWVGICEMDGTTGWVAGQTQPLAWCAAVRDYFRANDPFRRNAAGQSPLAGTKVNAASWEAGFDLRSTDNYAQQGNNVAVAAAIASDTQTFWSSAKPGFHAEFGGNTSAGASQPTHLHNGIWAGAANGAAMTPLVWCDGGSFPMLTADMQNHLQYLSQFMAGIDYLGRADLAAASVSFTGSYTYTRYHRGWGMKCTDRGYVWIQRTSSTVGGCTLNVAGLTSGDYTVAWYNVWASGQNAIQTATVTVGTGGVLQAAIPALSRADIACRFSRVAPNNPPVASDQVVETNEDTLVAITLTATDPDGDALTYAVVAQPAHGSLSGAAPNVTYTPSPNYNGPDSFTFKATDARGAASNTATVSISVTSVNDPPVAVNDSATTDEDSPVVIPVLANDTDADNDTLAVTIVTQPSHGSASVSADGTVLYSPDPNFSGSDSFTYSISDGHGGTASAIVTINVNAVNDPPVASDDEAATDEDAAVTIDVLANDTDIEGDALTVAQLTQPAHGIAFAGPGNSVTYSPDPDFHGTDSFTYTASDGAGTDTATVTVTVNPVNDPPVANGQSATTCQDTPVAIRLAASDVDGDALTYSIVSAPANGTLSGDAPDLTYTPNANYQGPDSFTFTANDGQADSNVATVSITVTPVNHAPVADGQAVTTNEDTPTAITLTASDPDGDPLTYAVVAGPSHGALSGTVPNLTYTPNPNYNGPDSFTFKANDGTVDSNEATVSITVTPVNDSPIANPQSVTTAEDTAANITLTATDADGDPLTCAVMAGPSHGALSGTVPNLTYTPNPNYNGPDSFTFKANDGTLDSDEATVSITVTPVNDLPVAQGQSVTTAEDTAVSITLTATDVDGDPLAYAVVAGPSHGALGGTAPNLIYTPAANYNGPDSFTFKANDGKADSNVATVSITVNPVNDPPVANPQSVATNQDTAVAITLTASDIENDTLTYSVVTQPAHGTLSGTAPTLTYTPAANYSGTDSFTFKANDGQADSNVATVSITVNPAAPTAILSIAMSKTPYGPYWKATATVTVKDSAGKAIASATVSGHWSGVYSSGTVSNTTNTQGTASFTSGNIKNRGTAAFTVDKVVKNGTTYILTGETSDSIAGP